MDTSTHARRRRARPRGHRARRARLTRTAALATALVTALAAALAATGCDTAQQVPWATYSLQLQDQIDAAAATHHCAALHAYLQAAKATSQMHEKATGVPNDALIAYIQAATQAVGCPAGTG
jgi:hypothetical protein